MLDQDEDYSMSVKTVNKQAATVEPVVISTNPN